jgi:hypothetical protein
MPRKLVALLFALGATLVAAPAAEAVTHAMVSYRTSTGLDVEDLDNQNNELRLSFASPSSNDSVNLVITEVAKDPRTNNPFGALEPGAGCGTFNGNDQQVHCVIPASGSKQIIGGDDASTGRWARSTSRLASSTLRQQRAAAHQRRHR